MENKHTITDLKQMQSLPLESKIIMTIKRINVWIDTYGVDGVYIAFSGGKDSTVLLDIIRNKMNYEDIPAVFVDTGLEYPEVREHVKKFDNIIWLKPEMNFKEVISVYGYPIISKEVAQALHDVRVQSEKNIIEKRNTSMWHRCFNPESEHNIKYPSFSRVKYDFLNDAPFKVSHRCCDIMKKKPSKKYEKETGRKPIIGMMACESRLRQTQWLKDGCNAFNSKRPTSKPLSFWTEQDILEYILKYNISIPSVYGSIIEKDKRLKTTGCDRTGCMFCMFGCSSSNWNSLSRMKETHPKQYEWIMKDWEDGGLNYKKVIDWINNNSNLNIKY